VAGCLPQRYQDELQALLPEVDAFIGVDQVNRVSSVIRRLLKGERGLNAISRSPRAVIHPPADRLLFTEAPYAYIRIADGCDHRCAFCAIPQIRGKYRSRSAASIVREAENLLNRGVRELNLIAQDVTCYGRDLNGKTNLATLLRRLGRIGGKFWIRLLYGHPDHITNDLLAAIGETPQICRYLDLPIQHCAGKILRMMGRNGNLIGLRKLFARIRGVLPDIALRTTCLVGFPGETDSDFHSLLHFVEETRFDHLGVFVYSEEEGTRAADLPRKVSPQIARQRKDGLMRCQQKIVAAKLAKVIGQTAEMFVEKKKNKAQYVWLARSRQQAPEIDSAVFLRDYALRCAPGILIKARYIKARGYDLVAEVEDHRN
ncbi:MAG: 30S ribosomal protein S12 methylthiotransferase RimO, partial [Kiritimatiellia bacterium]|nr:30S ribosomal protein S12 methylthiotransferase RimO [Kiritimatiellia bacterium]